MGLLYDAELTALRLEPGTSGAICATIDLEQRRALARQLIAQTRAVVMVLMRDEMEAWMLLQAALPRRPSSRMTKIRRSRAATLLHIYDTMLADGMDASTIVGWTSAGLHRLHPRAFGNSAAAIEKHVRRLLRERGIRPVMPPGVADSSASELDEAA